MRQLGLSYSRLMLDASRRSVFSIAIAFPTGDDARAGAIPSPLAGQDGTGPSVAFTPSSPGEKGEFYRFERAVLFLWRSPRSRLSTLFSGESGKWEEEWPITDLDGEKSGISLRRRGRQRVPPVRRRCRPGVLLRESYLAEGGGDSVDGLMRGTYYAACGHSFRGRYSCRCAVSFDDIRSVPCSRRGPLRPHSIVSRRCSSAWSKRLQVNRFPGSHPGPRPTSGRSS